MENPQNLAPRAARHDPLNDLIAEGKVEIKPYHLIGVPTILTMNFDRMYEMLDATFTTILTTYQPIRSRYDGTSAQVTTAIRTDVRDVYSFALWVTYNRLRKVAESYHPPTRIARLNTRAPCSDRMEFPRFIASTLQSIGPLRISDGPSDLLVLYAPVAGTAQNYGRAGPHEPSVSRHARFCEIFRACGGTLSQIDLNSMTGSYWTTCTLINNDGLTDILGAAHRSHYENEDVARALILSTAQNQNPFEPCHTTLGYVNDEATLNALAAVAVPDGIPAQQTAASAGRPVSFLYNINYTGIQLAVPAQGTTPAAARGCYILGRGTELIFACRLARRLADFEITTLMRDRILN